MKQYIFLSFIVCICVIFVYLSWYFLGKAEDSFEEISAVGEATIVLTPDKVKIKKKKVEEEQKVEEESTSERSSIERQEKEQEEVTEEVVSPHQIEGAIKKKVSMEFENADLKDVLKVFCQQSGLNFVAGENVEMKPITLYLSNVEIEDALNAIIKANGLTYERAKGSNVFIVRKAVEPEIKLETKVYRLNYANVEDLTYVDPEGNTKTVKGIKEILQKLISPHGDFSIDERTNTVIITDILSRFPVIEKTLKGLDTSLPQVLIEAKIVEVASTDEDKIGIKWSGLSGVRIRLENPVRQYDATRSGSEQRVDEYTLDTSNSETYEEVYHPTARTLSDTKSVSIGSIVGHTLTDTFSRTLSKSDIRSAVLSASTFEAVLSFLLTRTDVDVISSPNIVTAHGREAKIIVGHLYPIPQYAYNADTATWEVQGFEYRDIGVVLRVTPYVVAKEEGKISLRIHPEVSDIKDYVNFGGIAQIPIISTREAITDVTINSGDTLAIGGLLKNHSVKITTKVPILGDMPLIGGLFRHKDDTVKKTNLIIFITPRILDLEGNVTEYGSSVRVDFPKVIKEPGTSRTEVKIEEKEKGKEGNSRDIYNFTPRTRGSKDEW